LKVKSFLALTEQLWKERGMGSFDDGMTAQVNNERASLIEMAIGKLCHVGFIHPVVADSKTLYSERGADPGKAGLKLLYGNAYLERAYKETLFCMAKRLHDACSSPELVS
jgi:hypothetical protein